MRFFVGDDNGQLKSVKCSKTPENKWNIETSILDNGGAQGKTRAIQRLAVKADTVALARNDGSASQFSLEEHAESVQLVQQWQETRFRPEHQYVGLGITQDGGIISCTSAGHLRLKHPCSSQQSGMESSTDVTCIPSRLCEFVVSDNASTFAYGGDEVEVSVWDTARAFQSSRRLLPSATGHKRKKGQSELFDGEIWRAKNVPNDFLDLRQPVHNTTLVYLSSIVHENGPSHHILAGTRIGSVRRYDTRSANRPIADWKDVAKTGGIRKVERGNFEHEAFVSDHGSNLFVLDLRTGRVLYTYGGIAGAISSLAPTFSSSSPSLFASTSLDRFFRLHSDYMPPEKSGGSVGTKGEVLAKEWMRGTACCVAWDGVLSKELVDSHASEEDIEEDDVWNGMQNVGGKAESHADTSDSEDEGVAQTKKHRRCNSSASSEREVF